MDINSQYDITSSIVYLIAVCTYLIYYTFIILLFVEISIPLTKLKGLLRLINWKVGIDNIVF